MKSTVFTARPVRHPRLFLRPVVMKYQRASGEQTIKPAIVFRGKGDITLDELAKYDKQVDVYFQDKGWMDIKTNKEWAERTLMPGILDTRKESVLFC